MTKGDDLLLVAVEHLDKWKKRLRIGIPEADVARKYGEIMGEVARDAEMPGFRKGKVPPDMLERRYGAKAKAEALESLLASAYAEAIKEAGFRPICAPVLEGLGDAPVDGRHVFVATVEVRPEVEVGEYRNLEFTERVPTVTSEDVDRAVEDLRDEHADLIQVSRPSVRGDFVIVDYERLGGDGAPVPDSKVEAFACQLGSGELPPELETALDGVRPGDEKTVAIAYPAEHRLKDLAGKTVSFKVRVTDVREKRLPALSDDWAKSVARAQTLLDLRVKVRNVLEAQAKAFARRRLEEEIVRTLVERNPFDLPECLVEERLQSAYDAVRRRSEAAAGAEEPKGRGAAERELPAERPPDDFVRLYRPVVERQLKAGIILGAIAEKHGTAVTPEEIERRVARIAEARGKDPRGLMEDLKGTDILSDIEDDIWLEKVHDLLVSVSKVKTEYVDLSKDGRSGEAGAAGGEGTGS